MKAIINYFKKRQERRLRTRIALKASYRVNDLQAVYEFVKNEPPMITRSGYVFTDKFATTIDGGLVSMAVNGKMNFIDGSFCNNAKNL